MKLHYYVSLNGNFGDDLNKWIWDRLLPNWSCWDPKTTLLGVGTLFTRTQISQLSNQRILVIGSGAGKKKVPKIFPDSPSWDIRAVRGPRTARRIGVSPSLALSDPAVLISDFPEFQLLEKLDKPVFVPHHKTSSLYNWEMLCGEAGLTYVSPCEESRSVIRRIASAPLVIAESLHAAIIADSFRVPWIPVRISDTFDSEKWSDWTESLQLPFATDNIFPFHHPGPFGYLNTFTNRLAYSQRLYQPEQLCAFLYSAMLGRPLMSSKDKLEHAKERYYETIGSVIKDYSFNI